MRKLSSEILVPGRSEAIRQGNEGAAGEPKEAVDVYGHESSRFSFADSFSDLRRSRGGPDQHWNNQRTHYTVWKAARQPRHPDGPRSDVREGQHRQAGCSGDRPHAKRRPAERFCKTAGELSAGTGSSATRNDRPAWMYLR